MISIVVKISSKMIIQYLTIMKIQKGSNRKVANNLSMILSILFLNKIKSMLRMLEFITILVVLLIICHCFSSMEESFRSRTLIKSSLLEI